MNRCLAKSPEQRIQHATDLAFALEALTDSSSTGVTAVKEQTSARRWIWIVGGVAAIAMTAIFTWWKTPPAVPIVESVTQLTDDGEPKIGRLVSDGSRIYFNEGQTKSWRIAQVSVTGGRTARIDTQLAESGGHRAGTGWIHIARRTRGLDAPAGSLWSIPLPAGDPRRLGSEEVTQASYFPDGRVLLVKGAALYVANRDGSNPRKLVSVAGNVGQPTVSPDGKRIVFAMFDAHGSSSLLEIAADGSGLHPILNAGQDEKFGAFVQWSSDGRYVLYRIGHGGGSDLWAMPMHTGIFRRSRQPIRLTNGPLHYSGACPSRDGKANGPGTRLRL